MIMKKLIETFKLILLGTTFLVGISFATATPAGTAIVADQITIFSLNTPVVFSMPLTINVAPIYGFEITPSADQTFISNSLLPVYLNHTIVNKSNTTDNLSILARNLESGWQSQLIADANGDGIHQSTETTILPNPLPISRETTLNLFVRLTHTEIATLNTGIIVSTNHLAGRYQGFNGTNYGGRDIQQVTDNIYTGAPAATLLIEALLQGYYDPATNKMITANIKVELRNERTIAGATSYNIQLNRDGRTEMLVCEELAGNYYIYISHFNHIKVITDQKIALGGSITTINLCDSSSSSYRPLYLSNRAQNVTSVLRTESNNRLTIRGGDYNNDNTINIVDWSAFDYEWKKGGYIADFDGNGIIDTRDYGIWLSNNQDYIPIN